MTTFTKRAVLPFKRRTAFTTIIYLGANIIKRLTNNPNFDPEPPEKAIAEARLNELIAIQPYAETGDREAMAIRRAKRLAAYLAFAELRNAVTSIAKGKESVILSTGMEVNQPSNPVGALHAPKNLRLHFGPSSGSIKCRWGGVKNRMFYRLLISTDRQNWNTAAEMGAIHTVVKNLVPGQLYCFKVAAVDRKGNAYWSDIAQCHAAW